MKKRLPTLLLGLTLCGVLISCNRNNNTSSSSSTIASTSVPGISSIDNNSTSIPSTSTSTSTSTSIPSTSTNSSTTSTSSVVPTSIDVTFIVNIPSPLNAWEHLFVAVGFDSSWSTEEHYQFTLKNSDTQYTYTTKLAFGEIFYKFYLTDNTFINTWEYEENLDFGNDRTYTITENDCNPIDTVDEWKARPADPNGTDPDTVNFVFNVTLANPLNDWEELYLLGDNEALGAWTLTSPLKLTKDVTDDTLYSLTIELPNNISIEYKYFLGVVGEELTWDYPEDRLTNRDYAITTLWHVADDTIEAWENNPVDPDQPVDPDTVNFVFNVTLANPLNDWEELYLLGDNEALGAWTLTSPLKLTKDVTDDTLYSLTIELPNNISIEYKYFLGVVGEELTWDYPEDRLTNRDYAITTLWHVADDTIDAWENNPVDPDQPVDPDTVNFVFNVQLLAPLNEWEELYVVGDHNLIGAWTADNALKLTKDVTDDTLYSLTIELPNNITIEYKYLLGTVGGNADWAYDQVAGQNLNYGINSDYHTSNDILTSWGVRPSAPDAPETSATFTVEVPNALAATDKVYIAGTFNGWSTTATVLDKVDDTHYSCSVTLVVGSEVHYKYVLVDSIGTTWEASDNRVQTISELCNIVDSVTNWQNR